MYIQNEAKTDDYATLIHTNGKLGNSQFIAPRPN